MIQNSRRPPMTRAAKRRQRALPRMTDLQDWLSEDQAPVILNIRQTSISVCKAKYLRVACKCGAHPVRSGCMKRECEDCRDQLTKRRARRIYDRFEKVRGERPILYTVLTVPMSMRTRFLVRKDWRTVVKAFMQELKAFGFDFGVEISHPLSEEQPDVFHPHANILWIQTPGSKAFVDLDALRAAWSRALGTKDVVNLHHQYLKDKKQIRHRCRYVARVFPGFSTWLGSIRWYGKAPKLGPEVVECPKCHECFVILEFITDLEYFEEVQQRINTT